MGFDNDVDYGYDLDDINAVQQKTQDLIDYWYDRWLMMRLTTIDIEQRLEDFNAESIILGNI